MEGVSTKRGKLSERSSDSESGNDVIVGSPALDALMNHLVLKNTFEYLDTKNLLRFSLVNKLWCSTARSILRAKRRCLACIQGVNPCHELLRLNKTLLSSSDDHPFSGLGIRTCPPPKKGPGREEFRYIGSDYAQEYFSSSSSDEEDDVGQEGCDNLSDDSFHPESEDSEQLSEDEDFTTDESFTSTEYEFGENIYVNQRLGHKCIKGDLSKRYSVLLEKLNFRHFEIHWDRNSRCPAEWLISKILKDKGEILSELKVTRFPFSVPALGTYLGFERKDWLPKLKVLDLGSCVPSMEKNAKYDLIDAAPQLEKQLGLNRYHDLEYFLKNGRVSVMKHYDCFYPSNIANDHTQHVENSALMQFAMSNPKLTKFLFTGLFMLEETADTKKFIRDFVTILLDSATHTLEEMQMDQIHFILILQLNSLAQPLVELKKLNLGLSNNVDRRMGFSTLERFDWGCFCPEMSG
ncbi:unnamed protein product [Allacma fusca]|uniref:F-box domain-containing protein n=1 Tax=Allacma fusca TaxID=39272 RepID=A0A8J2PI31_9HEXA|nr:unnamed protein product [Allacma fusca]